MPHKAGFVNIIGNPNVGKSTLMNVLVGERISIITSKSQTTRHRIMGIVNGEDFQIIYSDTPGVLKPSYKLQESMLKFAESALSDADIILYVTDIHEKTDKNIDFIEKVKKTDVPTLLLINKVDQTDQEKVAVLIEKWKNLLPQAEVYPISALYSYNIDKVFNRIMELLPESPPYFDKDQLTDKPERFFVAEIIREKILLNYHKEVPYSTEVVVESFKETNNLIRIEATIYVARDTQKGIIIGKKGEALKKTGTQARKDIEAFLGKKVFLQLYVKVRKNWRDNEQWLRRFGYKL